MLGRLFLILMSLMVVCNAATAQTDKYTDKIMDLYNEREYLEVVNYKSKKESEMGSASLFMKGLSCFNLKNENKAISYFDKAIEKGPVDADMYYYKGVCHLIREEYDEAIQALTHAVNIEAYDDMYFRMFGHAYYFQEKFDSALVWYEKSVEINKKEGIVYYYMGECHKGLDQFDEAVADFSVYLELSEKKSEKKEAGYLIASCQYLGKKYTDAKSTSRNLIANYAKDYRLYSLLIQSHISLNEMDSISQYITALNDGKKNDILFPSGMRGKFQIDQFETELYTVCVFQSYDDKSDQYYSWNHYFEVQDKEGTTLFIMETQLDSTASSENTYVLYKIQGDSLFKYNQVVYDEQFSYLAFREYVKTVINGDIPHEMMTVGYKTWLQNLKKQKHGGNGMSFETAIMVNSIPEEYEYVRETYPGSTFMMQSLVFHENTPYDILHIKTEDGVELDIYFNIESFFGKY
ncbi:MAG: tetratricopeptide repeat protein [Crocinitomicaceae bacterium]|nr:tetratricopeptide repeat protein [Crocinitomicaceae bacterium]MBK8926758.1 tetratricopeptide repeat protein [Crocinitomicaceae bacterium]